MKYLTKLSRTHGWTHIALFILSLILSVIIVLQSIFIAHTADHILLKASLESYIITGILVILMSRAMMNFLIKYTGVVLSHKIKHQLRKNIINTNLHEGKVMNLSEAGIEGIDSFYADYLPQVYKSLLIPLAILVFLVFFHFQTAVIMLITSPFIPLFYIIIGINTEKKAKDQMMELNRFSSYFLNIMEGIMTIKLFRAENKVMDTVRRYSEGFMQHTMNILKTAFLSTLMIEFIAMLSIGIIALEIGLSLIVFNSVTFYTACVVLMLAPEYYNALKDLGLAFHTGKQASGYGEMLEEMETAASTHIVFDDTQFIDIKQLQFKYEQEDAHHFELDIQDLNLESHHYTIAGRSGSGKSTFAKLIAGLLSSSNGQITMNKALKDNIVYLSQDAHIISDTVLNNIVMYQNIPFDKVQYWAEKLKLHDLFMSMPEGYDTVIGYGGRQLSGGEARRLMLLRVFVNPKQLIIFDEPVAMLDIESEIIINSAIEDLKEISTVWTIAHHKNTILNADHLIFVRDNKVEVSPPIRSTDELEVMLG